MGATTTRPPEQPLAALPRASIPARLALPAATDDLRAPPIPLPPAEDSRIDDPTAAVGGAPDDTAGAEQELQTVLVVEDLRDRIVEETRAVLGPLTLYLLVLVTYPATTLGIEHYGVGRGPYLAAGAATAVAITLLTGVLAHHWFLRGTPRRRGLRVAVALELAGFGAGALAAALGVLAASRMAGIATVYGVLGAVALTVGVAVTQLLTLDAPRRTTVIVRRRAGG